MTTITKKPSLEMRLRVLIAIDYAPGDSIRQRIKHVASQPFTDAETNISYQFTWRTVSTWLYRYKKDGITTLDNKTRRDKNSYRKIQPNELGEAINEVLPTLGRCKNGNIPKCTVN
ncbi:MAG: hypothetical protein HRT37_16975 [Alteromonadaceae bacterium]|nr:hypothetical protein [Alteromonadaceae bacterium]